MINIVRLSYKNLYITPVFGKTSKEKYVKKMIVGILICLCFFIASLLPSIEGSSPIIHPAQKTIIQQTHQQTVTISMCVFDNMRTQVHQVVLSPDEAMKFYKLVTIWKDMEITKQKSNDNDRIQRQLLITLKACGLLSTDAITDVLQALSTQKKFQDCTIATNQRSCSVPIPGNKGTVSHCSISSNGTGILIPAFLFPRPRIATLWVATSGTTIAVNLDTLKGFNASGSHIGLAIGFIGIGFSFQSPKMSHYVVVGHAYMVKLYGENISANPP